ncbi:MAG: T9SS type A sorting domain-containing protein [Bacteroidetes bacterium]|nr:T9SS type A sorting domain-containing protein [Bacteroidota bacterium]
MKRIFTLSVLVLGMFTYSFGQQNVRGGTFEYWKYNATHNFYQPDSSIFWTLNQLDTIPTPPGITAYPCDTAHNGSKSVRVVTRKIDLLDIIIPGVIGTINIKWSTSMAVIGIPYPYGTTKPVQFSGFYQSYPLSGDSSAAVLLLSKWNSTFHRRDTLAYNRLVFFGTVNSWTQFDIPVTYRDPVTIPDSLTILLLSCGGFDAGNMFGSVGTVGSTALFDDVNLTGVNGFPLVLMPDVSVKLSPNPAKDFMNIQLGEEITNGYFEVYDAQAKLMHRFQINGTSQQISVGDLSSGMYYYKLTGQGKLLNSGTFAISK